MADQLKVEAKAKTVENEKSKKQSDELAKAKEKKKEADLKAAEEKEKRLQEEAEKKALAEQKKKEKEEAEARAAEEQKAKQEKAEKLVEGAAAVAALAMKGKKTGGFFKGLILGFIAGALVTFLIGKALLPSLMAPVQSVKDDADEIITETFTGYTAADFQDAILGEASQHQELVVMEQPLEIPTTLTKSGLGGFSVFSKVKNINYAGTGVYTVDLKNIDADHIQVIEDSSTVVVTIPHAALQYTIVDYDKITFDDTDKGLLAFGDITLTAEQQNELEKSVKSAMEERLLQDDILSKADEFAVMKTWEVFQPLVTAVSPEYKVEISFN